MVNQIGNKSGPDPVFYSNLMNSWKGFQETVQDQMDEVMENQQQYIGTFSTRWLERSSNIGKRISEMSKGGVKEYLEIYNIWKNYQNKINARIIKVTNIQNNGYSELIERWEFSRVEMMNILSKLKDIGEKDEEERANVDLYNSWLNVMNGVPNQIALAITQGNAEYQQLTKVWFEFLDNMKVVISNIPESNPHHEEIMKTWDKISMEMGSEISNLISESNNQFKKIQSSWRDATNHIHKDFSKVFKEINYEELYTGFFDRTAFPVFGRGFAAARVNRRMEEELERLKTRIGEMETQLKELKK